MTPVEFNEKCYFFDLVLQKSISTKNATFLDPSTTKINFHEKCYFLDPSTTKINFHEKCYFLDPSIYEVKYMR